MTELWRPIIDGDYAVSSLGNVRREKPGRKTWPGKILRSHVLPKGYVQIILCRQGKPRNYYVHRLVAEAFLGPAPVDHEVNHIDGVKANNALANLEYVTRSENMQHAHDTGLIAKRPSRAKARVLKGRSRGANHWTRLRPCDVPRGDDRVGVSKVTSEQVLAMRELWKRGTQQKLIAAVLAEQGSGLSNHQRNKMGSHMNANALDVREGDGWLAYNGDSCQVLTGLDEESVGYSVFSPPFLGLYCYSNSEVDFSNNKTDEDFYSQYEFLMREMFRVTKSGRLMSVHCMPMPSSKVMHGYIGLRDFPGELIRCAVNAGWIWHSMVVIRKDPVLAVQRTKALGLLWKQLRKDSAMSRMGIPDIVHTFRKPGVNASPITHTMDSFPVALWQKWAEPVWTDIDEQDTLEFRSAREDADEKHLCSLQLEVIRRCVRLWSNPNDVVLSPFMGIGSEGCVALEEGRKFIGCELKPSYYSRAVRHLAAAEPNGVGRQTSLLDLIDRKEAANA